MFLGWPPKGAYALGIPDHILGISWQSPDNLLTISWRSPDHLLTISRQHKQHKQHIFFYYVFLLCIFYYVIVFYYVFVFHYVFAIVCYLRLLFPYSLWIPSGMILGISQGPSERKCSKTINDFYFKCLSWDEQEKINNWNYIWLNLTWKA